MSTIGVHASVLLCFCSEVGGLHLGRMSTCNELGAVRRRRRAAAADILLTPTPPPPPTECRRRAGAVFVTCSRHVVHQLYVARFL